MSKRLLCLLGSLLSMPFASLASDWFETNSPLTQAHQHLLNNELGPMFHSMVDVWQAKQPQNTQRHLNELLLQSLTVDCGKGLTDKTFPDWLNGVHLTKIEIQSPGRDAHQVMIEIQAEKELAEISLSQWAEKPLAVDSAFNVSSDAVTSSDFVYRRHYYLNDKLAMGLYRLDVTALDNSSWSTWIILAEPKAKQTVRWSSQEQWIVDKNALLNRHCPLPVMSVSVYDYIDGIYQEVWQKSYESNYPNQLEWQELSSQRYILTVAMKHQRWQGPIIIEQSQVISKTYNVSLEE